MQSNPIVMAIYLGINKNFRSHIFESDNVEIQIDDDEIRIKGYF
jgi:hypothetical protein